MANSSEGPRLSHFIVSALLDNKDGTDTKEILAPEYTLARNADAARLKVIRKITDEYVDALEAGYIRISVKPV